LAIKKERLERGMRLEKLQTMSQVQEKIIHQQMSNYVTFHFTLFLK